MNLTKLKTYAPKARQDFIQAMTERAAFYGIKQEGASVVALPITEKGDGVVIGGRAFSRQIAAQRRALEKRIDEHGFAQTMEALAYTWFNRLVAIRYMEVQGYFDHGYRVLSPAPHVVGGAERPPEILDHAEHVELPGLDKQAVVDLKLDGNKDSQLYRLLLLGQCHALHATMPFIFPKIDDETELLLPENLLHTDSLIRKLASEITDEDCQSVEILGWLYQFYIADKKEEVMGRKKAVPTEDIPAVTQLFTPHWIVRYLVENSLGRLWLLNRPGSSLREQMPYYIEGEVETDFLTITKPEDIRLLDPAVGSGHMLSYAFDLLFAIYVETGYAPAEIPALILEHNLYGVDICPRAAQLAALTLVLKAREKSRRFFTSEKIVQPHICALQDVHFEEGELREYMSALNLGELFNAPMLQLLHQFEEVTTFGSLIQPCLDGPAIAFAHSSIEAKDLGGQLFLRATQRKILSALEQALPLAGRYHVVVTNPPYMGGKGMSPALKAFAKNHYAESKSDLFAMFMARGFVLAAPRAYVSMVTMQSWMFLSSYEALRTSILDTRSIINLIHIGYNSFPEMNSKVAQACAFVIKNAVQDLPGLYVNLNDAPQAANKDDVCLAKLRARDFFRVAPQEFEKVPGSPIAYWISEKLRSTFDLPKLRECLTTREGMATADNPRFLRLWSEVAIASARFTCGSEDEAMTSGGTWFPYNKGGTFQRWYGNNEWLVEYANGGRNIKNNIDKETGRLRSHNFNGEFGFREGVTWSALTSGPFSIRHSPQGFLFDSKGAKGFSQHPFEMLGLLNSVVAHTYLRILSPTLDFKVGDVIDVPLAQDVFSERARALAAECVAIARADWDNFETSWEFRDQPLLRPGTKSETLRTSWEAWRVQCSAAVDRLQSLETENNRLFIAAYGLQDELAPEVERGQITLAVNPAFRFKKKRKQVESDAETGVQEPDTEGVNDPSDDELNGLFLAQTVKEFASYAVGCIMGRYSLERPGLILANAGESVREYLVKVDRPASALTFSPDDDGIIPILDAERFDDDIVARTRAFLRATFGEASVDDNVRFIEEALGKDLRKYFLTEFYKDHRKTYKQRPIYWLFASGKERAFQCLVYLHRYSEGTLARMRTEYVIPLQGQIASRIEQLEGDKAKATSTSHRRALQKEQDTLKKQQAELLAFDEKLKHVADQKIALDLDDGVKVNYGKFGDLLADVDAVTGGSDE